jgi:hypothetical protein
MPIAPVQFMITCIWLVLSLFVSGFILMVRELMKAPEGIEDESGFRVIRQASASRPRQPARDRRLHWAFHRA